MKGIPTYIVGWGSGVVLQGYFIGKFLDTNVPICPPKNITETGGLSSF